MKRCYSLLLIQSLVFICASSVSAQTNWNWSNPRPQGGDLYGVTIKNDSFSEVVGVNGVAVRRVNSSFDAPVFVGSRRLLSVTRYLDTLWATGDSGSVYESTNNGVNWSSKTVAPNWISLWSATAFNAQRAIVVGDSGYAYLTTDAGSSWSRESNSVHLRMSNVKLDSFTAYAVGQNGLLYIASNMGQFGWLSETVATGQNLNDLSLNHSDTWIVGDNGYVQHRSTLGNSLIWDSTFTSLVLPLKGVVFTGQYVVVVGGGGVVLRSSDGGNSWTLPTSGTTEDLNHIDTNADANHLGTMLAVGLHGVIIKSTNYGQTWIRLDSGSRAQVLAFAQSPNGNYYGSSNAGGLFSSSNAGTSWRRDSINGNYNQLFDIQFERSGFGLMATNGAGVLVSTDSGVSWTSKTLTGAQILGIATTLDSIGVAVGATGRIYHTVNKGATWVSISSRSVKNFFDVDLYGRNGVIVGYGGTLLYTVDAGLTWTAGTSTATAQLNRVRMATATKGAAVGVVGNIWRTTDAGSHWSSVSSPTNVTLHDIVWHDDVNGMIVGDGGKILKTSNGGTSWTLDVSHVDQNLFAGLITSGTTAFVGGENGTILSTSNSLLPVDLISLKGSRLSQDQIQINWKVTSQIDNAGFTIERKNMIGDFEQIGSHPVSASNAGDESFTFVDQRASSSRSTYRVNQHDLNGAVHTLGEITVEAFQGVPATSGTFVYPNPASNQAAISVTLSASGEVTVSLLDVLGREVIRNTYGAQHSGTNAYRLDLAGLPAGVYHAVIASALERHVVPVSVVR